MSLINLGKASLMLSLTKPNFSESCLPLRGGDNYREQGGWHSGETGKRTGLENQHLPRFASSSLVCATIFILYRTNGSITILLVVD